MNKARIVLSSLALFALVAGALAFKASKFNNQPAYIFTNQYTLGTVVYSAADPTYVPLNPARFISTAGVVTTVYSTTNILAGQITTFTRVNGTQTITFPFFEGIELVGTRTTLPN